MRYINILDSTSVSCSARMTVIIFMMPEIGFIQVVEVVDVVPCKKAAVLVNTTFYQFISSFSLEPIFLKMQS